jgi:ParB/RepB/Spo0J family partition protein
MNSQSHSTTESTDSRLTEYDAVAIPLCEIYFDASFNSRGAFAPVSVRELAESIDSTRLQQPVIVQPAAEVVSIPDAYKYRLVCGHRRFIAVSVFLRWETIPAIVWTGLDETAARIANLKENLDRVSLNPLEEARGIAAAFPGQSNYAIAKQLNRSTGWVSDRKALLSLPDVLQQQAAAGYFTWADIREISRADNPIVFSQTFRKVCKTNKVARTNGRKGATRTRTEIKSMIDALIRLNLDGFPTRLLAWSAGCLSTDELMKEAHDIYKRRRK